MAEAPPTVDRVLQLYRTRALAEAIVAGRALVATSPNNADALGLLGMMLHQGGQSGDAAALLVRAVTLRPNAPMLHFLLGLAYREIPGQIDEAIAAFQRAIALEPTYADAHLELGNTLKRLERFRDAVGPLREAVRHAPLNAAAWLNLGVSQMESSDHGAVASFRRAVELEPTRAEAHNVLGSALMDAGEISAAQEAFRAALRLKPDYGAAHNNLARTFRAQGRLHDAIAEYRAALAVAPDPGTHSNLCYALNFIPDLPADEVWREHQAWGKRWGQPATVEGAAPSAPKAIGGDGAPPFILANPPVGSEPSPCKVAAVADRRERQSETPAAESDRRLRMGFVSPDLVNHAVAYFFEPLLAALDRETWETFCYSDAAVPDRVTERLRGLADQWRDTSMLRDEQLEAQIRRDAIDILVDLTGHTAHNRLRVFARKAAPVQVTWLGYPNTTGLSAIDYRITDSISDPPGQTERWHVEKLLRLPRAFLCYQAPIDAPPCGVLPAKTASRVTFASFSNIAKVSDPCLKVWATILQNVPASRLILKSRGLGDVATAARIHAQFQAHGVATGRVILDGTLVSVAEHLRQYNAVDIALDPFPYNGTTTSCEALWMGVPVVTLAGATHVARVGASLLTHLGHPEWIAATTDEYISHAVSLAKAPDKLSDFRRKLRAEMQRSPLCDAAGFAADVTAALRQAWNVFATPAMSLPNRCVPARDPHSSTPATRKSAE